MKSESTPRRCQHEATAQPTERQILREVYHLSDLCRDWLNGEGDGHGEGCGCDLCLDLQGLHYQLRYVFQVKLESQLVPPFPRLMRR